MPEFDKELYWKNREAGIRGQGANPPRVVFGASVINRARSRAKIPSDPKHTKSGAGIYDTDHWKKQKEQIRNKVMKREAVAKKRAAERHEREKANV